MMKFLFGVIAATALLLGGFFVGQAYYQPAAAPLAGNFNTTGGGTYNLQATITSSQTTIQLSSFLEPQSGIPYTMTYLNSSVEYATIGPQTSQSEFISFTGITQNNDGSATLTGVQRGLDRSYPYTASTTLALPHAGQTRLILSNPPQVYNSYGALANPNTWAAVNTFGSTTPPQYDADPTWANFTTEVLASVAYVNSVVAAGAANGSETVKGIYQLATTAQAALSTSLGSTGARLALGSNLATSTPGLATVTGDIPTLTGSFLNQVFLNLTQAFTFSTTTQYFANVGTLTATTSARLPANTTIGGLAPLLTGYVPAKYNLVSGNSFNCDTTGTCFATSTDSLIIPANTLTASSTIHVMAQIISNNGNGTTPVSTYYLRTSTGATVASCSPTVNASQNYSVGTLVFDIYNQNSANSQLGEAQCFVLSPGASGLSSGEVTSSINTALQTQLFMVIQGTVGGGSGNLVAINSFSILVTP